MFYTYLCLYRCRRLTLNGHEKIEIYPTAKTQMILGTNGSGKSSLVSIGFSVTPSKVSDYFDGGYKIVKLNHNGHFYELTATVNKKTIAHTFKMDDGDNLNPGKTAAVQQELVREHLGMVQEFHDLMTGVLKFTAMTPQERRGWITQLSTTDFSYVLNLYNQVKRNTKAAGAVVKHNSNRLTAESAKLLKPEDIAGLEKRSKEVRNELNVLFQECHEQGQVNSEQFQQTLHSELTSLESALHTLAKTPLHPPEGHSWTSLEHLEQDIEDRQKVIQELNGRLGVLGEEFQRYEHQMSKLKAIEGYDEAYIRKRIKELEAQINTAYEFITAGLPYDKVDRHPDAPDTLMEFMSIAHTVSEREATTYTPHKVQQEREAYQTLQDRLAQTNHKLGNIEGRLTHISQCSEVHCPQCGHDFKPGIQKDEQQTLKAQVEKGYKVRADLKEKLSSAKEFLDSVNDYQDRVSHLLGFRQRHPELSNFWGLVDRSGGVQLGVQLVPLCHLYLKDILKAQQIAKLDEELDPLKESLSTLEKIGGEGNSIREQYYQLKATIEQTGQTLRKQREELAVVLKYRNQVMAQDKQAIALAERYSAFQRQLQELVEEIRQDELREVIRRHQRSLAIVETALTESEIQYGIVNDLEKDIARVSLEESAYRLLQKLLSPVDGLIAESISLFINTLIDRINAVIARIWGYNLALKPCNLEEGELDYKFPLYAVKEDNTVPDIKLGSASQVDIVNQAFCLIFYKFMRMHGYPLYLDELERAFDPVHRHNLVPAVKDLIDDDTYSQVFIISHYITTQASFQDSEVIVLEESHLDSSFKRTYNEHVIFS